MPYKIYHRQSWVALATTLSLGLLAGTWQLKRTYDGITQEQQDRLETQAVVVSENIIRQLQGVANALTGLREEVLAVRQNGGVTIPSRTIRTLASAMPGVVGMSVFDSSGVVLASDKAELVGQSFVERLYFQIPRRTKNFDTLYVSPPYRSSRGNYSVNLSRVVFNDAEEFGGVVTANLDPEYFSMVARSVLYAPDMVVSIAYGKGDVFVNARQGARAALGELPETRAIFADHLARGGEGSSQRRWTGPNGQARMAAVRTIFPPNLSMDSPLLVVVSRAVDDVYMPWYDDMKLYGLSYGLLVLGASVAVYLVQLRQKALLRAIGLEADKERQSLVAAGLQSANAELEKLTVTDGLTGVGNRRSFDKAIASEWSRCGRAKVPLGILLVDIDHFKLFNDKHGHIAGDACLVRVATLLAKAARRSGELVARYGGEEFVILLPGADTFKSRSVAEDCLRRIRSEGIFHGDSPTASHVTVSIGIGCMVPSITLSAEVIVKAADLALYAAKQGGRNRAAQDCVPPDFR
jgi:diguanylate cyclase (GGDEF)-like protein